jgi:hypothetical protein
MSETEAGPQLAAVSLARVRCPGPLVLFQGPLGDGADFGFDLVVENLTPPDVWLEQIKSVIASNQVLREN